MLELRGVSKTYGQEPAAVHALAGVDLSVRAGEMVAVMGPSGSGKSTLLTIAGSLEDPTSGEVLVCGMALAGMPRGRKARLRRRVIGYVFQDFNLLPGLTAAENAALPLELDGVAVPKARAAGLAALDALGVADRAARFPDQLSGGERQRVAIARAVVGDRRLLLADEPSGALDSVNAGEVMRLLHEACQRGVAAVVVTHDAQLAAWADRIVLLRDGRMTGQTTRPPGPESLLMPGRDPVSTALRDPPDLAAGAGSRIVARRAVFRWGWRLFRREWRQQLLVLGLLTVAVAATIWGASVVTNMQLANPNYATYGTAAAQVTLPGTDPHLAADIATIQAAGARLISSRIRTSRPAPPSRCSCAPRVRTGTTTLRCSAWSAALPGRPRPGRADQPGRGPVRHARGRHLAGGRNDLAGDRHRAEPEQPGRRVRAGRPGPGPRTPAR